VKYFLDSFKMSRILDRQRYLLGQLPVRTLLAVARSSAPLPSHSRRVPGAGSSLGQLVRLGSDLDHTPRSNVSGPSGMSSSWRSSPLLKSAQAAPVRLSHSDEVHRGAGVLVGPALPYRLRPSTGD
jgi:hypothetical protein